MLTDPRLARLARVLVRYSVAVKKGDLVSINGSTITEPLALELVREVIEAGGHPFLRLSADAAVEVILKHASKAQLQWVNPIDKYILKQIDVSIGMWASTNTKALSGIDPARQAIVSKARAPLMATMMKRASLPRRDPKRLRWTGTMFPNQASAQDAQMSLSDYADFVFHGGKLDKRDPVAAWKKLGESQQRLADRLMKGKEMHITAPNGTDIRFGIGGRTWINCDGHENFPDGEVFTGPIEDATEGIVLLQLPGRAPADARSTTSGSSSRAGKRRGMPRRASNEEFLISNARPGQGGARSRRELALGTQLFDIKQYSKNTLFDEKIGGTFHAAVGRRLSRERRHEQEWPALGHGLRPAQGRRRQGRRRSDLEERPIREREVAEIVLSSQH